MTLGTNTKHAVQYLAKVVESARRVAGPGAHGPRRVRCVKSEPTLDIDRKKLLVDMLPLVNRVALKVRSHLPTYVELDELKADGVFGLMEAVANFDVSKQVKFASYAQHRIRGAILDGLRGKDPVPRDVRRKHKKVQSLYRELEANLRRAARDEEMAAALGMELAAWHQTLNEIQASGIECDSRVVSASPTATRQSTDPDRLTSDSGNNPFALCSRHEQGEVLHRALARLRERDRHILMLHYQAGQTMKQIAQFMRVDQSRVSQLHSAALVRLRANVAVLLSPPKG